MEMLALVPPPSAGTPAAERVRADLAALPFADRAFATVALLGNSVGFAGEAGPQLLGEAERVLGDGGVLIVEIAPAPGERSRYLARLPVRAAGRLFAAPPPLVAERIEREGFEPEPPRHRGRSFRRWTAAELRQRWERFGWTVEEAMAVAPAIGADPARAEAAAGEPRSWTRLLEVEEQLGREPARHRQAAALLIAVRRGASTSRRRGSALPSAPS